jgi:hypothetical protein
MKRTGVEERELENQKKKPVEHRMMNEFNTRNIPASMSLV